MFQAKIFEQSDLALPRVSAYFHQESVKELERAEAMLQYLSQRGGKYCSKNIQVTHLTRAPPQDLAEVPCIFFLKETAPRYGTKKPSHSFKLMFTQSVMILSLFFLLTLVCMGQQQL